MQRDVGLIWTDRHRSINVAGNLRQRYQTADLHLIAINPETLTEAYAGLHGGSLGVAPKMPPALAPCAAVGMRCKDYTGSIGTKCISEAAAG